MTSETVIDKSLNFSLKCIKLQEGKEFIISKQFLRSATSIGVNITEANAGQSKRDFFAKICIAFKEANETQYWLTLLEKTKLTNTSLTEYQQNCDEIICMLVKIKITTEKNLQDGKNYS